MEKLKALQIHVAAVEAEKQLTTALKQVALAEICYAYKSRVKKDRHLLEKVQRKQPEKSDYTLESITDVVGLRVVTLFRQDITAVVEKILNLISHSAELSPNPFLKGCLSEAIVYSPDTHKDSLTNELKIIIPRTKLIEEVEVQFSEAGYSSVHLVSKLNVHVDTISSGYYIPIEIQVRTVFEDAWGEIDHKYGYQSRRENDQDEKAPRYRPVKPHLLALKKFVDACAEYADVIKKEALGENEPQKLDKVIPLATDSIIRANLTDAGVISPFIDEYMSVRQIRAKADNGGLVADDKTLLYIEAASKFDLLLNEPGELRELLNTDSGAAKLLRYYITMDKALCQLSTGDAVYIEDAAKIYESLRLAYPKYPTIRFRLGQALGQLHRHEEAIAIFKRLIKSINFYKSLSESKRRVTLPDEDLHRICVHVPKLTGLSYWKLAEKARVEEGNLYKATQLLEQAYIKTLPALENVGSNPDERRPIINNLLYYAVEIEDLYRGHNSSSKGQYLSNIETHLNELASKIDISSETNIRQLDTLAYAYKLVGKNEEAQATAKQICLLMVEKISNEQGNIGSINALIFERAQNLLKNPLD